MENGPAGRDHQSDEGLGRCRTQTWLGGTQLSPKPIVAVGSDHAGFLLKAAVLDFLRQKGYVGLDLGAMSEDRFDYPLASDAVAHAILHHQAQFGVLICGSGIGVCIRANRYPGIRAAQVVIPETAALAREHNHANVICLGERIISEADALRAVEIFLNTPASQNERHKNRVEMLDGNISCS